MDAWYCRISVACDIMESHKGVVRTIWKRSPVTYASVVHSTWGNVADACTNIQQVTEEEEEEEDTPHVDTWRNARVWVDFFGGLH